MDDAFHDNQRQLYMEQQSKFNGLSGYLVFKDNQVVARITFAYNKANTSCTCFLYVTGCGMAKGKATGGGYDRRTFAAMKAVQNLPQVQDIFDNHPFFVESRAAIVRALDSDDGHEWGTKLVEAGLTHFFVI